MELHKIYLIKIGARCGIVLWLKFQTKFSMFMINSRFHFFFVMPMAFPHQDGHFR
ncbi:hypothetical protein SAMN05428959_1102 [Duganella sp. CF517]|nr:hypothetical protein SAMN05428959_1102 [Duganella sp. CF517]